VSKRTSATPFAKALFDVALSQGTLEATAGELRTLAGLMAAHADLARVLAHPALPVRAKREIAERVAAEVGVSPPVRRLIGLLADRDALGLLPQVDEAFQGRVLKHQGVVEAHVTTAVPLPPDKAEALVEGLRQATGKQVRLTAGVDPGIMGGVVARLGSTVYDGSVARHLERIRERMVGEGV
jgi:F-type H+-transporting ATPase subunit delta